MKEIWKYFIAGDREQITMPKGAKILSLQVQDGDICIWVLVDPKATTEVRVVETILTGQQIPSDIDSENDYIGTALMHNDNFVLHLFEVKPK